MSMNNNAPEKIYVHKSQYWGLMANASNTTQNDVEYVHKDAFIEKAWSWIENNILSSNQQDKSLRCYEQFKKYMEE